MNKNSNINILEEIKNTNDNKNAKITARKILKKYKNMKIPKKTYLIDEQDVETIDYNELQKDLFESESIFKGANKVLDYEAFKRDLEKSFKKVKKVHRKQLKKFHKNIKT